MADPITAQQMRNVERLAIESGSVTGLELMERAGQGVVEAMFEEWPALAIGGHRAVVLCGPGNNGGDGFVVARLLKEAGWSVAVYANGWDMLLRDNHVRTGAPPDARENAARWQHIGGRTGRLSDLDGMELCHPGHIVVIDALLGIGQNRDTTDILQNFHNEWDLMCNVSPQNEIHVVSVDVPTGYDTDSGEALCDTPVSPDLIVTFHARKPVHTRLEKAGEAVVVKDIGL